MLTALSAAKMVFALLATLVASPHARVSKSVPASTASAQTALSAAKTASALLVMLAASLLVAAKRKQAAASTASAQIALSAVKTASALLAMLAARHRAFAPPRHSETRIALFLSF